MNNKIVLGTTIITLVLSGCASIMSGGMDHVSVTSKPQNAHFAISDENGKVVQQGTTPSTVTLARSDGFYDGQTYKVSFDADKHASKTVALDTTLNGWYLGNVIFGGALGLLIIDPATGAMWDLPENLEATLAPKQ